MFFILRCSSVGGDGNEAVGFCLRQRHQHLLSLLVVLAENWATTSRIKKWKKSQDRRKKRKCKPRSPSSPSWIDMTAASGDSLWGVRGYAYSTRSRAASTRSRAASTHAACFAWVVCSCEWTDFLRSCVLFNFAGLAICISRHEVSKLSTSERTNFIAAPQMKNDWIFCYCEFLERDFLHSGPCILGVRKGFALYLSSSDAQWEDLSNGVSILAIAQRVVEMFLF